MSYFKKYYSSVLVLVLALGPSLAQAQYFSQIGLENNFTAPFTSGSLMGIVGTILQIAFALAGLIATFYIILGGYNYITAGGNPEAIEAAKATLTNAIIGLILVLVSYLLVDFLLGQLGATNFVDLN
jgi:hypothetical protein